MQLELNKVFNLHTLNYMANDDIISTNKIANNLTTTSSGYVLDARQGKVLNDNIDTKASITDMNKLLVYETKSGTTDGNGVIYVGAKTNYRLLSAVISATTWTGITICSSYSNGNTLYAVRFTYSTGASVANGQNLTFGVIWGKTQ